MITLHVNVKEQTETFLQTLPGIKITQIDHTGEEKAISLSNVDKDGNRTCKCEAKSGIEEAKNKTEIELIVIHT